VGSQVIGDLKSHLVEKGIEKIVVQLIDIPSGASLKNFFKKNDFIISNGGWAAFEFSNAKLLLIPTVKKGVKVSSNYQLTPLAEEDLFNDPSYKAIINRDDFLSNFCFDGASGVLCPVSSIILKREGRVVGWIGSTKISHSHYKLSPLFLLPSEPQILGIKLTSCALDKIQKMDSAPSAVMIASSGNPSAAKLIYSLKEYSSKVYYGCYAYNSISKG
jgi:hypothetical protein